MFIGQLKAEKKISSTTPGFFFPPSGSVELYIWYTDWFFFPPIKITWEAKSWNLRLSTNWAVLLTPPVFSLCQTLCLDKTIYLYHFQAGQTGSGWEVPRGGGVREGDCFTCCQRALISPAVCWSRRWGHVPQEHFGAGPCQWKAVLSHDPNDGLLRETGIGVQIILRHPQ